MDIFDTTNLTQAQSVLDTLTVEDGKVFDSKKHIASIYPYGNKVIIVSKNQKEKIEFTDEYVTRRVRVLSNSLDVTIFPRGNRYILVYPKQIDGWVFPLYEEVYSSYEEAYEKFKEIE